MAHRRKWSGNSAGGIGTFQDLKEALSEAVPSSSQMTLGVDPQTLWALSNEQRCDEYIGHLDPEIKNTIKELNEILVPVLPMRNLSISRPSVSQIMLHSKACLDITDEITREFERIGKMIKGAQMVQYKMLLENMDTIVVLAKGAQTIDRHQELFGCGGLDEYGFLVELIVKYGAEKRKYEKEFEDARSAVESAVNGGVDSAELWDCLTASKDRVFRLSDDVRMFHANLKHELVNHNNIISQGLKAKFINCVKTSTPLPGTSGDSAKLPEEEGEPTIAKISEKVPNLEEMYDITYCLFDLYYFKRSMESPNLRKKTQKTSTKNVKKAESLPNLTYPSIYGIDLPEGAIGSSSLTSFLRKRSSTKY